MKNKNEKPNYILLEKEEEIKAFKNTFNNIVNNYSNYKEIIYTIVKDLNLEENIFTVDGEDCREINKMLLIAGVPVVAENEIYSRKIKDAKITFKKHKINDDIKETLKNYEPINLLNNNEKEIFVNLKENTLKVENLTNQQIASMYDEDVANNLKDDNEKLYRISLCAVKKLELTPNNKEEGRSR